VRLDFFGYRASSSPILDRRIKLRSTCCSFAVCSSLLIAPTSIHPRLLVDVSALTALWSAPADVGGATALRARRCGVQAGRRPGPLPRMHSAQPAAFSNLEAIGIGHCGVRPHGAQYGQPERGGWPAKRGPCRGGWRSDLPKPGGGDRTARGRRCVPK